VIFSEQSPFLHTSSFDADSAKMGTPSMAMNSEMNMYPNEDDTGYDDNDTLVSGKDRMGGRPTWFRVRNILGVTF
jgi:hypothetical protein